MNDQPNQPTSLTPLETELLRCVTELEPCVSKLTTRQTQLEEQSRADYETAREQRKNIRNGMQSLLTRIASLEESVQSLRGLSVSLQEWERQCVDLRQLLAAHGESYSTAIRAFREMQRTWQAQQASNQVLSSQVPAVV